MQEDQEMVLGGGEGRRDRLRTQNSDSKLFLGTPRNYFPSLILAASVRADWCTFVCGGAAVVIRDFGVACGIPKGKKRNVLHCVLICQRDMNVRGV